MNLNTVKKILREHGYIAPNFVYPYNSTSVESRKQLPKSYLSGFAKTGYDVGGLEGKNINMINYEVGRNALGSYFDKQRDGFPADTSSLSYYKALVDDAFTTKNWLVFVVHPDASDETQVQHVKDTIDYILAQGGNIVSPSEGLNIYGNALEFINGENRIIIDANGNFDSNSIRVKYDTMNQRKVIDSVTSFPKDKITVTPISTAFALSEGYPEGKAGYLKTIRGSSEYFHAKQEYIPILGTGNTYSRIANSDYTWGTFESDVLRGHVIMTNSRDYTPTNAHTDFPNQKVVYTSVTSDQAASNGFPRAIAGVLITTRFHSDYWGVEQRFITSKSIETNGIVHEYVRNVDSDGVWADWKQVRGLIRGSTLNRPSTPIDGYFYFDTSLGKPIWYNGSTWVDATGATV